MPLLFEYGESTTVSDRQALERSLSDLWRRRIFAPPDQEVDDGPTETDYQPFLQFDGDLARARNYVGFIQNSGDVIEIYPKVFRGLTGAAENKRLMLRHIFYWFSYCRKWRFPFSRVSRDNIGIDRFPELIINLIANQFLETVSKNPLSMYQPVEEALQTPRGSINFKRYISSGIARGNYQNIECDYEPFLFDNKVNRVIKYCARLLLNQTRLAENLRLLQEVTFILGDVEDVPVSVRDLDRLNVNPFFSDYNEVLDSCRIVLNQQLYSSHSYEMPQWCLLFPMEYIFEDFIAGFLETHFGFEWLVEYQKSDMFVTNDPRAFQMQHDIFLTNRDSSERKMIVDAKYKLRDPKFKQDEKKGIEQSDLYQMLSYAVKRGCSEILLLYPNLGEELRDADTFIIETGFETPKIRLMAAEIPFWSFDGFEAIDARLRQSISRLLRGQKPSNF